jgi:starch synthase
MHVVLAEFTTSIPYTVLLANALSGLCELTLMLPDKTPFRDHVDRDHIDLHLFRWPRLSRPSNILMVRHILKRIAQIEPDIVHVTFWSPWVMPALGLFAKSSLISTVHDVSKHVGERGLWAVPSFLYRWQWHWSSHVIVHATTARQQLVARHGCQPERVHVIPIGSFSFYHSCSRIPRQEECNTVLFFGRIWGYKGLQYLIEAEPLITQAVPDARIIIAGRGEPFEKYRRAMVNPQHFEVHNYRIPDEMVSRIFQSASVVVLPYIEASQSGVIPIAYAFGKPVVATTVGGIPDIVDQGQTGYLVPPRDPHSLAEAIITLLKDRQARSDMGRKAREKAQGELSWSNIARRTVTVYKNALAQSA